MKVLNIIFKGTLGAIMITGLFYGVAYAGGSSLLGFEPSGIISVGVGDFDPEAHNAYDLGQYGLAWRDIYSSGTIYSSSISMAGDINPVTNSSYDLGQYDLAWEDIYASGSLYIGYKGIIATSTIYEGLETGVLNVTTSTATSTFNNGVQLTNGCLLLPDGNCAISSAGAGANNALSNLSSVAINTSLLSDANNTDDLGAYENAWKDIYASGTLYGAAADFNGNVTLGDKIGNSGDTITVNGELQALFASSTLQVESNATLYGDLRVGAVDADALGKFYVDTSGNIDASGTLTIAPQASYDVGKFYVDSSGNISTSGTLYGGGNNLADIGAYENAWKDIYASGTLYGNIGDFAGTLDVLGLFTPSGGISTSTLDNVTIGGSTASTGAFTTLTSSGDTDIGDTNSDTLTLNADIDSNVLPNANNNLDLGEYDSAWKDIYASGTMRANVLTVGSDGTASSTLGADTLAVNDTSDDGVGIFYVDSSGNVSASGTLYGGGNNSADIGAYENAWKDIYASGTLYATSTAINTLTNFGDEHLIILPNGANSTVIGDAGGLNRFTPTNDDLFISGDLEVENKAFFEDEAKFYTAAKFFDNREIYLGTGDDSILYYDVVQTPDALNWGFSNDSQSLILTGIDEMTTDYGHLLQHDPTVFIHSSSTSNLGLYSEWDYNKLSLTNYDATATTTIKASGTSTFDNGISLSNGCYRNANGNCIDIGPSWEYISSNTHTNQSSGSFTSDSPPAGARAAKIFVTTDIAYTGNTITLVRNGGPGIDATHTIMADHYSTNDSFAQYNWYVTSGGTEQITLEYSTGGGNSIDSEIYWYK